MPPCRGLGALTHAKIPHRREPVLVCPMARVGVPTHVQPLQTAVLERRAASHSLAHEAHASRKLRHLVNLEVWCDPRQIEPLGVFLLFTLHLCHALSRFVDLGDELGVARLKLVEEGLSG